jgi:hypothetical protein
VLRRTYGYSVTYLGTLIDVLAQLNAMVIRFSYKLLN